MDTLLFALWFFLPAGVANAAPIIAAQLPYLSRWDAPMDFGKTWRSKRIFGTHKTWRGLLTGIVAAVLTVYVQQAILDNYQLGFLSNYDAYLGFSALLLGFLFGFGALMGDAVESFLKRQFDIADGQPWFPFDQTDYIIGGCLAAAVLVRLNLPEYIVILATWFLMHLIFSYIGYLFKLKSSPI